MQLLAIPVLIARGGVGAWADLAVAQSVGGFFAVLVAFGWGVTGPAVVAVLSGATLRRYYLRSFALRTALLVLVGAPAVVVTLLAVQGQPLAAVFAAVNLLVGALAGGWYYVGRGDARGLFVLDTLPRLLGTAIGVLLVAVWADLLLFTVAQTIASAVAVVPPLLAVLRLPRPQRERFSLMDALRELRSQLSAVVVAATAALYTSAPLVLVSLLAPAATPLFAVADRIFKFSLNPLIPITQALQGWVPSGDHAVLVGRCRSAARIGMLLGLAGGAAVCLVLALGAPILTGGRTELPLALVLPFGLTFAAITVSRIVGLVCLVSLGRVRALAVSTVIGAALGVGGLLVLIPALGAVGAALALMVSEVGVTWYQLAVLRRATAGAATAALATVDAA